MQLSEEQLDDLWDECACEDGSIPFVSRRRFVEKVLEFRAQADARPCQYPNCGCDSRANCASNFKGAFKATEASAPGLSDEVRKLIQYAAEFIGGAVNYGQNAPDEPPGPVSQWDYDAHYLAQGLQALLTRASAAAVAEPTDERRIMQLAAISTAAIGYWKEGDSIHPDYDSTALRDTAKLYVKYDELFKAAQQQAEPSKYPLAQGYPFYGDGGDAEFFGQQAEPSERTADEIVAEQQRTHEFVQFPDRTRYVANIDPKKGIKPYPEATQQQAEPGADERAAYDKWHVGASGSEQMSAWAGWQARAAQSGQRAGVAEGWKLVPIEPTFEMLEAGDCAWDSASSTRERYVYKAMIAAAPTHHTNQS